MSVTINTNIASLNAQRNLTQSQTALQTSLQRLSSGLRVNSAMDDAAGIAIGARMSSQIRGMTVATRNANDGISLAQTAEGALSSLGDMAQRMRELAVQSSNPSYNATDRTALQAEFNNLAVEMDRVAKATTFNGNSLFGTAGTATTSTFGFQVGANAGDVVNVNINSWTTVSTSLMTVGATSTTVNASITSAAQASAAITSLDTFIQTVNTERANLGAAQSNLHATVSSLQIGVENLTSARSRIMDTDYAAETANLTRAQILQQAGTAMLAQANQTPKDVLSLLK